MIRRVALAVLALSLLAGGGDAHVSLPWPGPGGVAGAASSCPSANFELDFSNNCNLIYYQMVIR